jgi:hypothetical protein
MEDLGNRAVGNCPIARLPDCPTAYFTNLVFVLSSLSSAIGT